MPLKRYINVKHQRKPIKHWMILLRHTKINIQRYRIDVRTGTVYSVGFHFQTTSMQPLYFEPYRRLEQAIETKDQTERTVSQ